MKVYVYKNGLCDPGKDIGTAKEFSNTEDLDDYINFFCSNIDPKYMKNWRVFITNDEIGFLEVDHFVLMEEYLHINDSKKIEEVNVHERALTGNVELLARDRNLSVRREKARKASVDRAVDLERKKQTYARDLE